MSIKKIISVTGKLVVLTFIFLLIYIGSANVFFTQVPALPSDPSLIPAPFDILVYGGVHVIILALVICRSRWYGWRLALAVGVAYYGFVSFMSQIETWWFLSNLTVTPLDLKGLFLMGLPPAFLFVPLAVWVLGKWKAPERIEEVFVETQMPPAQWAWKVVVIGIVYVGLYFAAGYYIAWRNPALRAFYGGTDPGNFISMMVLNFQQSPLLIPFQFIRGILWVLFALPVIRMGRRPWETALLAAIFISIPMSIGCIMANPYIPDASVRISHLIEITSSNFIFGMVLSWLFYRRHSSIQELFGLKSAVPSQVVSQAQ